MGVYGRGASRFVALDLAISKYRAEIAITFMMIMNTHLNIFHKVHQCIDLAYP